MSNALVLSSQAQMATTLEFSAEQRNMIRNMYAKGSSDEEFNVLIEIARARRLNPLLKQVYFVQRWDSASSRNVWTPQVSIDGMRAVAERTGKYDGQDEPEFIGNDGVPVLCKVKVYRKDWNRPAVGVAYYAEYVQKTKDGKPTRFWAQMPHVMLAKCAEALALRKAFPEDTGGLYVPEEMAQASNGQVTEDGEVIEPRAKVLPMPTIMGYREIVALIEQAVTVADKDNIRKQTNLATKGKTITPAEREEIVNLWAKREEEINDKAFEELLTK